MRRAPILNGTDKFPAILLNSASDGISLGAEDFRILRVTSLDDLDWLDVEDMLPELVSNGVQYQWQTNLDSLVAQGHSRHPSIAMARSG